MSTTIRRYCRTPACKTPEPTCALSCFSILLLYVFDSSLLSECLDRLKNKQDSLYLPWLAQAAESLRSIENRHMEESHLANTYCILGSFAVKARSIHSKARRKKMHAYSAMFMVLSFILPLISRERVTRTTLEPLTVPMTQNTKLTTQPRRAAPLHN